MDIHTVDSGEFSITNFVKAHLEDLAIQEKFDFKKREVIESKSKGMMQTYYLKKNNEQNLSHIKSMA